MVTVQKQVLALQETLDKFMRLYMEDQKLFDDIPAIGNIAQATKDRVTSLHKDIKDTVEDAVEGAIEDTMPKMEKAWKFWRKRGDK